MMNRKRLMASSGVLAFVLVIGVVAVVAARNGDGARPASNLPKLAYGTGGAGQDRGGMQASLAPAFPVTYEVRGALPALSDKAPAYTVKPDPSRDRINRVAAALGVATDAVVMEGQPAKATPASGPTLMVGRGGWTFATTPSGCTTSSDGVSTCTSVGVASGTANASSAARAPDDCPMPPCPAGQACAQVCPGTERPVPVPPPAPVRPADLPSQQEAERIGRDVLAKSGVDLDHADVQVTDGFTSWSVMASPRIDGFATQGLETTVVIGAKGAIEGGYGSLVTLTKVGDYPLAGTSVGLERLKSGRFAGPVPMLATGGQPEPPVAVESKPAASGTGTASSGGSVGTAGAETVTPVPPPPTPAPDAKQPLPAPQPVPADPAPPAEQKVVITGVHVALMRSFGSVDAQSLVPVYVFETDPAGAKPFMGAHLFPVPAVTDAHLATDPTPPVKP